MQKKLKRIDEIIRDAFAQQAVSYADYLEITGLIKEINDELKQKT